MDDLAERHYMLYIKETEKTRLFIGILEIMRKRYDRHIEILEESLGKEKAKECRQKWLNEFVVWEEGN